MRIRLRFSKLGKIRFTSQRDVARMWERALRRARLPLAYTGGFSPRPQLSFGLALPTGCESLAEYLDVVLDAGRPETADVDVAALPARLTGLLPTGIDVHEAAVVERRIASLQQEVTSCSWTMTFSGVTQVDLAERTAALLAAPEVLIVRERKGRQVQDDLRPSVLALSLAAAGQGDHQAGGRTTVDLVAELATQPRGVRPGELARGLMAVTGAGRMAAMAGVTAPGWAGSARAASGAAASATAGADHGPAGEVPVLDRACRTQQWIERDGVRWEPLELRGDRVDADRAVHALERAS